MPAKRKISAAEFVEDLRSGMTLSELMDKYSVVPRELDAILLQLRQSVINPLQAYGRSPEEQTSTGIAKIRFFRRHQVGLPVRVHDASNPEIWGYIRDVSERGLGIQGIEAAIDEIKTLVIFSNEFFSINQISLVAKCRWVTPTGDTRKCLTGFETIRISDSSFERLKRFIEACARARTSIKGPCPFGIFTIASFRQGEDRDGLGLPFLPKTAKPRIRGMPSMRDHRAEIYAKARQNQDRDSQHDGKRGSSGGDPDLSKGGNGEQDDCRLCQALE